MYDSNTGAHIQKRLYPSFSTAKALRAVWLLNRPCEIIFRIYINYDFRSINYSFVHCEEKYLFLVEI